MLIPPLLMLFVSEGLFFTEPWTEGQGFKFRDNNVRAKPWMQPVPSPSLSREAGVDLSRGILLAQKSPSSRF